MRRIASVLLILAAALSLHAAERKMVPRYNRLTHTWASYPMVTIQDIQQVPLDSLLVADTIQNNTARWNLQTSPYSGDTVTVTALCVVPAKVITYTAKGFTMLIYDTASTSLWKGVLVRVNSPTDTVQTILDGFENVEPGDIIQITGLISEFPTSSMNSLTQFQPIAGIAIDIVGSMALPSKISKTNGDFYQGIFSGGKVHYSTGEPYEGMYVEVTGLTVDAKINTSRGTFSAVDASGNEISEYDLSRFFTLKGTSTDHPFPDTMWTRLYASMTVGTKIDTMRGVITTASGSENARGYRIAPIYYGDIVFGSTLPSVTTHRRYPVLVPSDTTPLVTVKAVSQSGSALASVVLYFSLNGGAWTPDTMILNVSDTTYRANLPMEADSTNVRYFIKAIDGLANSAIYANAGSGGSASDTSKGFFFYNVIDRPLTIYDIQYTPYKNGRTPYAGAIGTVTGIVTADTSALEVVQANSGWTSAWYIQSGNQPWSGLWVVGAESLMAPLKIGDSVSVTGNISEDFDVTQIYNVSSVSDYSGGNTVPAPVVLTTGRFGANAGNGDAGAEPYESMLVTFNNVTVTNTYPTFSDPTEYEVDDGSGAVLVQHGGMNSYSNQPGDTLLGKTIIHQGDRFSSLTGIIYYSYNRYKFVPRTNADFGPMTAVHEPERMALPKSFALGQNYPNPFNPSTKFDVSLPHTAHLSVEVYNLLGQKVATLADETRPAGVYTVIWNGTTQRGTVATSGVYFVRMSTPQFTTVRKVLLMK